MDVSPFYAKIPVDDTTGIWFLVNVQRGKQRGLIAVVQEEHLNVGADNVGKVIGAANGVLYQLKIGEPTLCITGNQHPDGFSPLVGEQLGQNQFLTLQMDDFFIFIGFALDKCLKMC